jgi:hypothetical protein
VPCSLAKAARPVEVYLAQAPKRLAAFLMQIKRSLKDAATVNFTRWALANALHAPVSL